MDVDLLRPGTVPISPDTILWFEYLLDPDLLKKQLNKANADPSPTDLLEEFLSIIPKKVTAVNQLTADGNNKPGDIENPDSPAVNVEPEKFTRKQLALKILALKVAAYLKWNLDLFERKLAPQTQYQLVQDLCYIATDGAFSIPPQVLPPELELRDEVVFAVTLFYRWVLRFCVNAALMAKPAKIPYVQLPGMPLDTGYSKLNPHFERLLLTADSLRSQAIKYLTDLIDLEKPSKKEPFLIKVPVMEVFVHLTEDYGEMKHDWCAGDVYMSEQELNMQLNYDLTYNYFFYGQYDLAKRHILRCKQHADNLQKEITYFNTKGWGNFSYASVSKENTFGYIRALNLAEDLLAEEVSLTHKMQESVVNNYSGLIAILQNDNLKREIPYVYREMVELDIQGSSSSGIFTVSRDLLNRVVALNVVRAVLEAELPCVKKDFQMRLKSLGTKFLDMLFWGFAPVLQSNLNDEDWKNIRNFFINLSVSQELITLDKIDVYFRKHFGFAAEEIKTKIFNQKSLDEIKNYENVDNDIDIPKELLSTGWELQDFSLKSVPDLEIGSLKQKLIDASTPEEIRICLVNLAITNPSHPLWKVNAQWQLVIPLQSVVMSLQRGFLQDFSYILLGKARQRAEIGDYKSALEFLLVLEGETRSQLSQSSSSSNTNIFKLCKLLGWEILLLQIYELLNQWPQHNVNITTLAGRCRACVTALQSNDPVLPRIQIVEASLLMLLNSGEWDVTLQPNSLMCELCINAAAVCELQRTNAGKPNRKFITQYWDLVLSAFVSNGQTVKRTNTGRETPQTTCKARDTLNAFLNKLRDPTVVTTTLSLLSRIYNILNDNSNLDLSIEYLNLWPTSINNTSNYNITAIYECLNTFLESCIKFYPQNASWIKLYADLSMANGFHTAALKNYLICLCLLTDYFTQPLTKQMIDDQTIYRKMIKCCSVLNCHTQAGVLCQFLDECDYVLAFKYLSEKSNLCSDAMDGYYVCIWDVTILEFLVNLHHKRGETHRKQLAIKVMGLLELNSNNNEEIQREAANSRKCKFMRAMLQQFVAT